MADLDLQPAEQPRARRGKIARMPATLREEVCRRLHNGETAGRILAWLNAQPEALAVLAEHFAGEPVTPQNLSDWRTGGYQDWIERRERLENLKVLSDYSLQLAKAGGTISEGAAAIAGGKILEFLETASQKDAFALSLALAKLRDSEARLLAARTSQENLARKDRALDLEEQKFQRATAKLFLKWHADQEVREILNSRDSAAAKMDSLITRIFGKPPQEPPA